MLPTSMGEELLVQGAVCPSGVQGHGVVQCIVDEPGGCSFKLLLWNSRVLVGAPNAGVVGVEHHANDIGAAAVDDNGREVGSEGGEEDRAKKAALRDTVEDVPRR